MAVAENFAGAIGKPPPRAIPDAGHFLQEDKGPEIGAIVAEWLTS